MTSVLAAALLLAQPTHLVVSVAASMNDALVEIADLYRASTGIVIDLNAGGSNTLARQIVEGAPVDVFLSADDLQMDVVSRADRLVPGTRAVLLTNQLVVIVRSGSPTSISQASDLTRPDVHRIATGEPESVPAGIYARAWLERLGLWGAIAPKVVPFPSVLGALTAVEAGRVDAGVVYRTDAMARSTVKVAVRSSSQSTSDRIVHSVAVIRGPREATARAFATFLQGPRAQAVFVSKGFGLP
jgi:molybdate transport system substrate-binding protein